MQGYYNPFFIPSFLTSILLLLLGILVYLKNRKSFTNILFSLECLTSFVWQFGYSMMYYFSYSEKLATFWMKIGYVGVIYIPVFYYHFIFKFLGQKKERIIVYISYGIAILFTYLHFTTNLLTNGVIKYFWGYYPCASKVHPIFLIYFIGLINLSTMFIFLAFLKEKQTVKKEQIKYLFLAFFLYSPACVDYIANYNISFYPFGYIFATIFLVIVAYAIVKHHLMDINVIVTKLLILLSIYGVTIGTSFIILEISRPLFSPIFGPKWYHISIGLSFTLYAIAPYVYLRLRRKAQDWLYGDTEELQQIFKDAPKAWININDINNLSNMIMTFIDKYMVSTHGAFFILDKETNDLILKATSGNVEEIGLKRLEAGSPLLQWFTSEQDKLVTKGVLSKNEVEIFRNGDIDYWLEDSRILNKNKEMKKLLLGMKKQEEDLKAALILPCYFRKDLIGILVLGRKNKNKSYNEFELKVLAAISTDIALVIKNLQLRENMAEKEVLANLGQMSAGIAHDLRGPLTNFKNYLFLLQEDIEEKLQGNIPDTFVCHDSIAGEIEKMCNMINDLLDYGRSKKVILENLNMNEMLDKVLKGSSAGIDKQKIKVTREYKKDLSLVQVDKNKMERVFSNIINNAIEAMNENGELRIKTNEDAEWIDVIISDNGKGIPKNILPTIFRPFVTYGKKRGTGLGLAIVDQFIRAHKGEIQIDTQEGKGTTFTISIPREKREYVRLDAEEEVKIEKIPSQGIWKTKNISTDGICFTTSEAITVGEYLHITVNIPIGTDLLEAIVRVAWQKKVSDKEGIFDIGVEIIDMNEKDRQIFLSYIQNKK